MSFTSSSISGVVSALSNIKNEKTDNPILRFPPGLIRILKNLSILLGIFLLLIGGTIILGFINPELINMNAQDVQDGELSNMVGVFIVILVVFVPTVIFYLFFKRKEIKVQGNEITYRALFGKTLTFNISDIESVEDVSNNKIKLILKSKQKISVDYQLENFQTFKGILKSHDIKVPGKELW